MRETVNGEIVWDSKGRPLFAIVPMEFDFSNHLSFVNGDAVVDCEADNSSTEELEIRNGKIVELI